LKIWINQEELPRLISHYRDDGTLLISDTRYGPLKEWVYRRGNGLPEHQRPGQPFKGKIIYKRGKRSGIKSGTIGGRYTHYLQSFVDDGLAIEENNTYLGLALPEGTIDPPYSIRCLIPMPN
jgi:hypothetical protein